MSDITPYPHGSISRKFNADGSARRFPGNAVLCRIATGNPAFATIESIQSALRHERFARHFAFVPTSTFHMTIFDGAKEDLREAGAWPAGMGDKSLGQVSAAFAERLKTMDVPAGFNMRPTDVALDPERGSVIHLAPGDHAQVRRLRVFRERLAELLGLTMPVAYTPHITLSHLVSALNPEEHRAVAKTHAALTVHLSRALSTVEFGWPEFCTHENVLYFERHLYLDGTRR